MRPYIGTRAVLLTGLHNWCYCYVAVLISALKTVMKDLQTDKRSVAILFVLYSLICLSFPRSCSILVIRYAWVSLKDCLQSWIWLDMHWISLQHFGKSSSRQIWSIELVNHSKASTDRVPAYLTSCYTSLSFVPAQWAKHLVHVVDMNSILLQASHPISMYCCIVCWRMYNKAKLISGLRILVIENMPGQRHGRRLGLNTAMTACKV